MNNTRRQLLKVLSLAPWAGGLLFWIDGHAVADLDDDFVIVDGWILKKSEVADIFE